MFVRVETVGVGGVNSERNHGGAKQKEQIYKGSLGRNVSGATVDRGIFSL